MMEILLFTVSTHPSDLRPELLVTAVSCVTVTPDLLSNHEWCRRRQACSRYGGQVLGDDNTLPDICHPRGSM